MPLNYQQLNQTQAGVTFGEGRVSWELAGGRGKMEASSCTELGSFSSSFPSGRSCQCGFCCLWRGAAMKGGSVSPACPSLPGEGCPVAGGSAVWSHSQQAELEQKDQGPGLAVGQRWSGGLAGRPKKPWAPLSHGASCHVTPALLALGIGVGLVASSPVCRFCRARCQPGACVSSCCKCYEFFTKQASLIV